MKHRPADEGKWRDRRLQLTKDFAKLLNADDGVKKRLAPYLALLRLTAELAHQYLPMCFEYAGTIESICEAVKSGLEEADPVAKAVQILWDAYVRDKDHFCRKGEIVSPLKTPCFGMASAHGVGFIPSHFRKILDAEGFEPDPLAKLLANRNYLGTYGVGNGLQKRVMVNGEYQRVYFLRQQAVNDVCGLDGTLDESHDHDDEPTPEAA